ncbi:MAG TPA: response regulator transcription factor [Chloroflexota bacterium]|nr:response regulator transcription factor [Chloroflexota bacterium]
MPVQQTIRVLLADDHVVFRLGLRDLLTQDGHVEVVGEAETGEEAVERTRQYKPDVVVMDVRMPHKDGIQAIREIKAELPETQVVAVSGFADNDSVFNALQAGASGFLSKDDDPSAIQRAVSQASSGTLYLGPSITKQVLDRVSRDRTPGSHPERSSELTPRETLILRQMAAGKKNREMAAELGISERTVGNYMNGILSKLDVHDRAQAIVHAVRRGIVRI